MSKLKLLKAIWEIRYEPAATLFDNRGRIADKWYQSNGFEDWVVGRNQVTLTNRANTINFHVEFRKMHLEIEGLGLKEFCQTASIITGWTSKVLKIKKIDRIGFRNYLIIERDSFEKTRERLIDRLFKLNEDDWNAFGGEVVDVGFPLTLDYGETKANFRMGPMQKKQYDSILRADEVKDLVPESSFLIDFDMYQNYPSNLRSSDLSKSYRSYLEKTGGMMQNISNNIMSQFGGFNS